jgi:hypothetical protein
LSLSVAWQDEAYVNPVDQKTYVAPGGWETYQPDSPRAADPLGSKVKTEEIRLLTAQDLIAARTMVEDLAAFCKAVERCAEQLFAESEKGFKVMVQFKCSPSGHEIQMAHQGDASQELLQAFYESLARVN